jgi:hypothetical protein
LARVIAHELVHAICPSEPHTATGLMSARLTRELLTQPRLDMAPRIAAQFHASLSHLLRGHMRRVAGGLEGGIHRAKR